MNLGLDTVLQLNPVTFNWKYNDQSDYGFLAEDLEKINPMLVFYNQQGQVEGVKYDRLTAVLANAVQELNTKVDNLTLTDDGNIVLSGNTPDTYAVATPEGTMIDRVMALAELAAAKIRAGLTRTNELQVATISPLSPDQSIIITAPVVISSPTTSSQLPDTPILIVDGELEATTISARLARLNEVTAAVANIDQLTANNIVADTISANHIEGLDAKLATLSAELTDSEVETITDRIKARLALLTGNEPSAEDVPVPTTNYQLPTTASDSASLASADLSAIALASADIDFVTINNYLAVIGSATITDLDITNHLYTESISSKTGLLALGGNTLLVDSSGAVTVNGDLKVTGTLIASELNLGRLNVFNEAGETVATIDASGSANLATLATQMITIASPAIASASAGLSELIGTTTSNATAGESVLISPNTELTIESLYVTPNSLVYLTPTTNTDNKVLFVKSKESCVPTTNYQLPTTNCKASFTVAIDAPASSDISFNWWIIQLQ